MDPAATATRPQAPRTCQILRDRIVLGQLAPSEKLKIADLASELGVSPGAVREALSQLSTENLVEARDQRGFRVAPISLADLRDLTETRLHIEALALRQAIARGGRAWEAALRKAHRALQAHPARPGDLQGAALHAAFHTALVAGCGSPALLRIRASLYDLSERYRWLAMRRHLAARPVADEHATILAATLARDADAAVSALCMHISLTTELVLAAVQEK